MAFRETEFEMVERHVRQGAKRVARQLEIIADMQRRGEFTGLAESLLFNLERSLSSHQDHLGALI